MGKGKPRTALHRRVNQYLATRGNHCEWWDFIYNNPDGCFLPWCGMEEGQCKGNPFVCKKMYYKHLASAKKINMWVNGFTYKWE